MNKIEISALGIWNTFLNEKLVVKDDAYFEKQQS